MLCPRGRAAGRPWRLSAGCAISLRAGHADTQTGFLLLRLLAETQECVARGDCWVELPLPFTYPAIWRCTSSIAQQHKSHVGIRQPNHVNRSPGTLSHTLISLPKCQLHK